MQRDIEYNKRKTHVVFPFLLYLIGGILIFFFGSNTFRLFPTNKNALYEWVLTGILLLLVILLRRSARYQRYWPVPFALFVASFGNALNLLMGNWLAYILPISTNQMQFLAIDKLSQAIPIIASIIILTRLSGGNLSEIFLKKGDLKKGLKFGFISFGIFAVIFTTIAIIQSNAATSKGLIASGISLETIISSIPWILIFIFTNSFMEELWFRGISLKKLDSLIGMKLAILATALVFGISHIGATYITSFEMIIFPIIVFAVGLGNAHNMLKTDSIWGSVLFHAGYDLLVIIPVLASS